MVDFVGILRKAIDAQNNATSQLREQIYERALETLEYKFVEAKISKTLADTQRKALEDAIKTVEEEYVRIEKRRLSSLIGWQSADEMSDNKSTQDSISLQNNHTSFLRIEDKQQSSTTDKTSDTLSIKSDVPDAEFVNMDNVVTSHSYDGHHDVEKNTSENSESFSLGQVDSSHIVSHIFSQALKRANRPFVRKRIMIGTAAFCSFVICLISIFLLGERVFLSNDNQLQREKVDVSGMPSKVSISNKKLTQRLLENGSEVDVGLVDNTEFVNDKKMSTAVSTDLKTIKSLGEAILYQSRTDYDEEKVATGSVQWSVIKEASATQGKSVELALRGDLTIPDEGLSLQMTFRRNTNASFPAAYIIDFIFITSDQFSGKAISDIKALTFKASEQSVGQSLTRTVSAKINDDFFIFALSGNPPFFYRNLQLIRQLNWIRLVMSDKNGRIHELTFAKGAEGEAIFNDVIGTWLTQKNKSEVLY
ncbi:hypothetical protein [Bartonella sp. F02]|uniref:hypothetical protein n=1 Tax=Bartonella sp. F02 TaxID=2967262 RepID=UPI0022A8E815|nr:hypothetical protein [Bartonella sp. F02]MCZ2328902.1 hypothetical protein [Bartonella sp. F02]